MKLNIKERYLVGVITFLSLTLFSPQISHADYMVNPREVARAIDRICSLPDSQSEGSPCWALKKLWSERGILIVSLSNPAGRPFNKVTGETHGMLDENGELVYVELHLNRRDIQSSSELLITLLHEAYHVIHWYAGTHNPNDKIEEAITFRETYRTAEYFLLECKGEWSKECHELLDLIIEQYLQFRRLLGFS